MKTWKRNKHGQFVKTRKSIDEIKEIAFCQGLIIGAIMVVLFFGGGYFLVLKLSIG